MNVVLCEELVGMAGTWNAQVNTKHCRFTAFQEKTCQLAAGDHRSDYRLTIQLENNLRAPCASAINLGPALRFYLPTSEDIQ